jgi:PAS domain S-box-containing protein
LRKLLHRSDVFLDSRDPILIEDLEGRIIDLDEAAAVYFGWTQEELIGEPIEKLIPPEWHSQTKGLRRRCLSGEDVRDVEGVRWNRTGDRIPVLLSLCALRNEAGRATAIATIARDVSRLNERDGIVRAIETNLPVVLWAYDLRSERWTYVSHNYEAIWGQSRRDLLEHPESWLASVVPEEHARVKAAFDGLLLRGEPYETQYRIRRPDGAECWIHDTGRTVQDRTGHPLQIVGLSRDITRERRRQQQLRAALLAARQAEETERKRLGADLHDSVGQLLPLARMKLAELLDEEAALGLPSAARESIAAVDELLAAAEGQIRTMAFQLTLLPSGGQDLLSAVESLAGIIGRQYGLIVTVQDDGLPKRLDERRSSLLLRGIRELLINAGRHAQTDKAEIRMARSGEWLVVTVADGGLGFDSQSDEAFGIGLSSLRASYAAEAGSLEIESAKGNGTQAILKLPLASSKTSPRDSDARSR